MSKITPIIYDGPAFKRLRLSKPGVSVYALEQATKISRQQINRFEAGENTIYLTTLTRLLDALHSLKSNQNV